MYVHVFVNRTQTYLDEIKAARLDERSAAAWRGQWMRALKETAGLAPSLKEGVEYVDDVRRVDAERLAGLNVS